VPPVVTSIDPRAASDAWTRARCWCSEE
jgi:hypothetical protein